VADDRALAAASFFCRHLAVSAGALFLLLTSHFGGNSVLFSSFSDAVRVRRHSRRRNEYSGFVYSACAETWCLPFNGTWTFSPTVYGVCGADAPSAKHHAVLAGLAVFTSVAAHFFFDI